MYKYENGVEFVITSPVASSAKLADTRIGTTLESMFLH